MSDLERRYAPWPDLVAELVLLPDPSGLPRGEIEDALAHTFQCEVSWNWRDADGVASFEFAEGSRLHDLPDGVMEGWVEDGGLDHHPLLHWFARTRDSRAMTVGRVPRSVAPPAWSEHLAEHLAPHACEEQMSIPIRNDEANHRAYLLIRGEEDFSDDDVSLARRIQPLLELLDRQARILEQRRATTGHGLTGRELAILELLSDGLTAAAIGRRLDVSPRTVGKHLEHLYRKLGVGDRLQAVLVAREAGLVAARDVERSLVPLQRGPIDP